MYSAETMGIQVIAVPQYASDRSDPERSVYFWTYTITIRNLGAIPVQLRARYWRITDELGRVQEVEGPGVVGEEPRLEPGESFEYTSGCPLTTPSGFMVGRYRMQTATGDFIDVAIPAFSLDLPDVRRVVN